MDLQITNINRIAGNDLTAGFTMRYRLSSDPDVDGSYTTVTDTLSYLGITYPYFPAESLPPGEYVVHTYLTASGSATGTKMTVNINAPV